MSLKFKAFLSRIKDDTSRRFVFQGQVALWMVPSPVTKFGIAKNTHHNWASNGYCTPLNLKMVSGQVTKFGKKRKSIWVSICRVFSLNF